MMTNLFTSFDPSSIFFKFPLNWLSSLILISLFPMTYWLLTSRYFTGWNFLVTKLSNEFNIMLGNSNIPGSIIIFTSLFTFILINNSMGLFPYIFTSTSHLSLTLSLAFPLWVSLMLYGWFNNYTHMFAHLLPQNTPIALMSFMVLIETVSNIIRPLTLSVRLMANMMAGHLLLTLLSNLCSSIPISLLPLLLMTQILLLLLETAVSLIQSYVFTVLSALYTSEIN